MTGLTDSLLLTSGLGSLVLDSSLASSNTGSSGLNFGSALGLAVWVKLLHHVLVGEWVLLVLVVKSDVTSHGSQFALDGIRVDDSSEISTVHGASFDLISVLLDSLDSVGSENVVEGFESTLGEDCQSTEVTTWGQLEQVKSVDIANINSWQVTGGSLNVLISVAVDDQRSLAEDEARVSHLTSSGSLVLHETSTVEISTSTGGLEGLEE